MDDGCNHEVNEKYDDSTWLRNGRGDTSRGQRPNESEILLSHTAIRNTYRADPFRVGMANPASPKMISLVNIVYQIHELLAVTISCQASAQAPQKLSC